MDDCTVCLEKINNMELCINNCGHTFCKPCIDGWLDKGKRSCPLCRQDIRYFENNGDKYRVIFKTINNSQRPSQNRRPILNPDYVPINRKLFNTIKLAFYGVAIFAFIQSITITRLKNEVGDCTENYHICSDNNTLLNDYIESEGLLNDIDAYDDYSHSLIYDTKDDVLKPCIIPKFILDRCFT